MALSDKILNRQATALVDILGEVNVGVAKGHPADATLAAIYRRHREFGSRDRRLFSDAVFSFFRARVNTNLLTPTASTIQFFKKK